MDTMLVHLLIYNSLSLANMRPKTNVFLRHVLSRVGLPCITSS